MELLDGPRVGSEPPITGRWDEIEYERFFRDVNGFDPYAYQVDVANRLARGENLVLQAPTGAGKTAAVLTPFLFPAWQPKPARLIYALPLRTLVQSVAQEAARMVAKVDGAGEVTIQTGEQPDDEFFGHGRIVVATYDQVLSGMLLRPYGLSDRLHNINAAAMMGTLIVFDEFHLMEIQRAFLTAAAGLHLFGGLTQTVWMTATATPPLVSELRAAFAAQLSGPDDEAIAELPTVAQVERRVYWHGEALTATAVAERMQGRVIVIANTVGRAQSLFKELTQLRPDVPAELLHARFFQSHRKEKEGRLAGMLGRDARGPALLVATQVIEAGVDISCDQLHTELAPMNSVVQRCGRCARFPSETGDVHVYELPDEPRGWLPYGDRRQADPALDATRRILAGGPQGIALNPVLCSQWVRDVHASSDASEVALGWASRLSEILSVIRTRAIDRQAVGVAHLIREPDSDDRRVIVAGKSALPERPAMRDSVTLSRWRLMRLIDSTPASVGWYWDFTGQPGWRALISAGQLAETYIVAIRPEHARYTREVGLEAGERGEQESPEREERKRPGHSVLHAETWIVHAKAVADEAVSRHRGTDGDRWLSGRMGPRFGLPTDAVARAVQACALAHDLGKLQVGWQEWAAAMQRLADGRYEQKAALAHTDFDPSDTRSREMGQRWG